MNELVPQQLCSDSWVWVGVRHGPPFTHALAGPPTLLLPGSVPVHCSCSQWAGKGLQQPGQALIFSSSFTHRLPPSPSSLLIKQSQEQEGHQEAFLKPRLPP